MKNPEAAEAPRCDPKERSPARYPRPGAFTSQGTRGPGIQHSQPRGQGTAGLREPNERPDNIAEERLSSPGAAH